MVPRRGRSDLPASNFTSGPHDLYLKKRRMQPSRQSVIGLAGRHVQDATAALISLDLNQAACEVGTAGAGAASA